MATLHPVQLELFADAHFLQFRRFAVAGQINGDHPSAKA